MGGSPVETGDPVPVKKILILRFSSLGDIVMATPLVRALRTRFPSAQIDMAVREDFLDLIRSNPHLNQRLSVSRKDGLRGLLRLRRRINAESYDIIYDAHRSLRTRLLMPWLKARGKFYFAKHYLKRSLALTFKLPLLKDLPRTLERYIEPLSPVGVLYDGRGPEIFIDEATQTRVAARLRPKPTGGSALVGIIPSAQWPGKRWPWERFRGVLQELLKRSAFDFVVFGGPEDHFCEELCADLPIERVTNLQGKLSIAESTAALSRCALIIANDTGLMHVADGLNIPSVLILGPTSKELGCLPFHPQSIVLEHQLWCRPCSKNGEAPCIRSHRLCLEKTTVEDVVQATLKLGRELSTR